MVTEAVRAPGVITIVVIAPALNAPLYGMTKAGVAFAPATVIRIAGSTLGCDTLPTTFGHAMFVSDALDTLCPTIRRDA